MPALAIAKRWTCPQMLNLDHGLVAVRIQWHAISCRGLPPVPHCACRRSQELNQAANAIGHATIRVLVLDSLVVQCNFGPLEPVQALVDFVNATVVRQEYKQAVTLFVSPPKRKITGKMAAQTFWDAGMVPGVRRRQALLQPSCPFRPPFSSLLVC
jgi:hypothetical protein